jgi:hypothetical protein
MSINTFIIWDPAKVSIKVHASAVEYQNLKLHTQKHKVNVL